MHPGIKIHPRGPRLLEKSRTRCQTPVFLPKWKTWVGGHFSPELIRSRYCRAKIINRFASKPFNGEPCVKKLLYASEHGRQKKFVAQGSNFDSAASCFGFSRSRRRAFLGQPALRAFGR